MEEEEEKQDKRKEEEEEKEKEEEEKEQEDKDEGKEKQQEKMRVCSVPESGRTKKTTLWLLPRTLHEYLWFFFFALLCAYAQSQQQRSRKVQQITTNVPQQRTLGIRRPAYYQQRPTCRWLSPPHLLTRDLLPLSMCLHLCDTLTDRSISTKRTCLQIFIVHVIIICFPLNHTTTPMNHEQYT